MDNVASNTELNQSAINEAINCNWDKAIELNLEIIKDEPENVQAKNRLAKAYCETGQFKLAKSVYEEVLKIDPYNGIATKNLKKVAAIKADSTVRTELTPRRKLSTAVFLHEPGVTKMVNLIKIAEPSRLLTLSAGSIVYLVPKLKSIGVVDEYKHYLGVLPDDTAFLLLKLIKGGNEYEVIVKSVKQNAITVLIRETVRSKKFKNQPSFIDEVGTSSLGSDNLSILTGDTGDRMMDDGEESTD
jgi:tetratricopeptide (TPR) repeat protein